MSQPTLFDDVDDRAFIACVERGLAHVEWQLPAMRAETARHPEQPHPKLAEYEAARVEYRQILGLGE